MLERKKILDGNAIHVQERDVLQRDIKTAQETLNDVRAETKAEESMRDDLKRTNEIETRDFETAQATRKETIRGLEEKETAISGRITLKASQEAVLDTAIQAKTDHHDALSSETTKYQSMANSAKQEHAATIETLSRQLRDAQAALQSARTSLEDTKKEEEGLLINRRTEEKRIAQSRGDLSIWENRIKKAAEAVGIDPEKIIV